MSLHGPLQRSYREASRPGGSGGFYRLGAELSPDCASEPFEQHHNAILIPQLNQRADHVLKGARGHPYKLSRAQRMSRIEAVKVTGRLPLSERGDDTGRYGSRLVASANDVDDTKSGQDRAPTHRRAVDAGKKIAWEKRAQNRLAAPRMVDLRAIARQIGRIPLPQQMIERLSLTMRMRKNRATSGLPYTPLVASYQNRRLVLVWSAT